MVFEARLDPRQKKRWNIITTATVKSYGLGILVPVKGIQNNSICPSGKRDK